MKSDYEWTWQLIGHDPVLRQELALIEQHVKGDSMVEELLEFFAKVEGGVRVSSVLFGEGTWRLGDEETERLAAG